MPKRFKIPVIWQEKGFIYVDDVKTLDEAKEAALDDFTELPDGEYVDGSMQIDALRTIEEL